MHRTPLPAALDAAAAGRPPRLAPPAEPGPGLVERLTAVCGSVSTTDAARVEASRDWWPLSTWWAVAGVVPALPAVVCRPDSAEEVAGVLRVADESAVPVTPFAGASGVCGGSIPVHGGISLDLTGLAGIRSVDDESLLVDVGAGTFAPA
ncbi:MAG TPA: FAD-binding protein, partial [Acidimicrobiales bacterium]|nr:FAD-binding protein [Acidimicrobiales bacterium]